MSRSNSSRSRSSSSQHWPKSTAAMAIVWVITRRGVSLILRDHARDAPLRSASCRRAGARKRRSRSTITSSWIAARSCESRQAKAEVVVVIVGPLHGALDRRFRVELAGGPRSAAHHAEGAGLGAGGIACFAAGVRAVAVPAPLEDVVEHV